MRLVLASNNAKKQAELALLFAGLPVELVAQDALGIGEADEPHPTFVENALAKARHAAAACGAAALADDSGLVVDALGGAPGIYSARWAEDNPDRLRDFGAAMEKVERELHKVGAAAPYQAHFVSVIAFAQPDGEVVCYRGEVHGTLVFPPRGTLGFGYDPIFLPEGLARTFGEMMMAEKQAIPPDDSPALSHRARAFQAFARAVLKRGS
jgi:XTP/dITP diphosphohydrolase